MGIVVLILIYILNSKKSFYFFNCEVPDSKTLSISSAALQASLAPLGHQAFNYKPRLY